MNEPKTQDTSNYEQLRAALVLDAASKPIVRVCQYDGFTNVEQGEIYIRTDSAGDFLDRGESDELGALDCVRVQFPKAMPLPDAARVLRKLLALVEFDAKCEKPAAPDVAPSLATATLKAALAMVAKGETF